VIGNHDQPRIATRVGPAQARVAAMLLLTLRGTPTIYYGDELGMTDTPIPPERLVDPQRFDGPGRDPARTPMPWDATPTGGFTTGEPWLPVAPETATVNVESERGDPRSIFSLYRRLIWFRRSSGALRWGRYRTIDAGDPDVFAYERSADGDRLLVVLSFTGRPLRLDLGSIGASATSVLSTDPARLEGEHVALAAVDLGPDEGRVLRLDDRPK
jgi:alpha-glucosidase